MSAFSQTFVLRTRDQHRVTNIIRSFSEKVVKTAEQKMRLDASGTRDFRSISEKTTSVDLVAN
jgi:hypothetical protein